MSKDHVKQIEEHYKHQSWCDLCQAPRYIMDGEHWCASNSELQTIRYDLHEVINHHRRILKQVQHYLDLAAVSKDLAASTVAFHKALETVTWELDNAGDIPRRN